MKEYILKNKIYEVVSNKTFSEWEVGLDIDEENKIISISFNIALANFYSMITQKETRPFLHARILIITKELI